MELRYVDADAEVGDLDAVVAVSSSGPRALVFVAALLLSLGLRGALHVSTTSLACLAPLFHNLRLPPSLACLRAEPRCRCCCVTIHCIHATSRRFRLGFLSWIPVLPRLLFNITVDCKILSDVIFFSLCESTGRLLAVGRVRSGRAKPSAAPPSPEPRADIIDSGIPALS